MTETLRKNAEEAATRDWLSAGQSRINDAVRGILEIELHAERVIDSLSKHLHAHRAALFFCDETNISTHFAAGYANQGRMTDSLEFQEGEGLLGQVARDREPILIDEVPPGYFRIESALGQATPVSMILFPLLYNDCLMSVVELASFERFADRHIDFLSSVQENICIALRAAQSQVELRQLLKQHAIFFRVFKDATDPIVLEDLSGNIVDLNAAAESAYGWTKEELVGLPIKQIVPEDRHEQADELQQQCVGGGEVRNVEGLRLSRSGEVCDVLITLSLLRDEKDKPIGVASIAKDVTAFKARQAAEEANRAKSDFLANMSHEIRTPMNGIIGMTELALDTELTKEQREYLTTIESSADSLLSLINDILDFSKIEAKKLALDPTDFELRERIGETLVTLAMRAHDKGLELAFDVDPAVPEHVVGDVHRLRQVLMNLLGNAIKFTEKGEIVLRIELVRQQEEMVTPRFAVSDTGIGLPPDKLESIFRPFEQADASTTRKYGGTGLGLAISVRLVELMGGKMEVQSELGRGTTFSFTADLGIGSQRSETHAASETAPLHSLTGMRVLVVDDNETNRRILAKMLDNWGMTPVVVDSAARGLAALQASLSDQPIRLILSDVNMPEMDGFMLAEKLMSDDALKNTPIILLTSANRTGDGARCRELGIAAHLIKPARQSLLFDAIATSVGAGSVEESPFDRDSTQKPLSLESRRLRLLLAEDNETNQKFAVRALTKAGHWVEVATNGQEAVDVWTAGDFDAVLMDIQMPVMDGYLATAEIRQREATTARHTPIIAMTAHAMKGDKEKCLEAGMDGYVTKPIKSKIMLAEITRVMEDFSSQDDFGSRQEPMDD